MQHLRGAALLPTSKIYLFILHSVNMKTPSCMASVVNACILISLLAGGPVTTGTGTLIILQASKEEIVVAADSRMHYLNGNFDDRCKINAFGDELIFAAAGTTLDKDETGVRWDAHTIARSVFDRLSKDSVDVPLPRRFAEAWGNEVNTKLKEDLIRNPQETLQGSSDNVLISAIFAGFYDDSPLTSQVFIAYDNQLHTKVISNTEAGPTSLATSPMHGHFEIADELFNGKTERACKWRKGLMARTPKGSDPLAFMTIDAISFSIANQRPRNIGNEMVDLIGGPIDAVRLKRTGGIDWIHRKKNCPAN
jgi:hypothetical protein